MPELQIHSDRQNRTVHRATLDEPALLALASRLVAEQVGAEIGRAGVTVRAYTSSYQEGSLGTSKTCIKVELTVEHQGAQEAQEAPVTGDGSGQALPSIDAPRLA